MSYDTQYSQTWGFRYKLMAYATHIFPIVYYASVWKLQILHQQMSSVADQEDQVLVIVALFLIGHWPFSRGPNHAGRIGQY